MGPERHDLAPTGSDQPLTGGPGDGTYLVAVDDVRQQFAGCVRIWANARRARLSLVGVAHRYRRRGLARALLASALQPVHEHGIQEVMAEVDASNPAGLALVKSLGAVETGSSMVLRRRS